MAIKTSSTLMVSMLHLYVRYCGTIVVGVAVTSQSTASLRRRTPYPAPIIEACVRGMARCRPVSVICQ